MKLSPGRGLYMALVQMTSALSFQDGTLVCVEVHPHSGARSWPWKQQARRQTWSWETSRPAVSLYVRHVGYGSITKFRALMSVVSAWRFIRDAWSMDLTVSMCLSLCGCFGSREPISLDSPMHTEAWKNSGRKILEHIEGLASATWELVEEFRRIQPSWLGPDRHSGGRTCTVAAALSKAIRPRVQGLLEGGIWLQKETPEVQLPPSGGHLLQALQMMDRLVQRYRAHTHTTTTTTNHHQPPPTTNHQPPTTNHQRPTTNHQPPTTNHQPPPPHPPSLPPPHPTPSSRSRSTRRQQKKMGLTSSNHIRKDPATLFPRSLLGRIRGFSRFPFLCSEFRIQFFCVSNTFSLPRE